MRSIKNISMILLVAMAVLLAFAASPASAKEDLPVHSVYIGDTAVSIDYLMSHPADAQALVNQLVSQQGLTMNDLWYQISGESVKNIGTGTVATPEEITQISGELKHSYDADGEEHDIADTYAVTFTVVDEAEAAIENATVVLGEAELMTDASGVAVFEDLEAAEYNYAISKEGYITQNDAVSVVDEDVSVPITLAEENDFSIVNVEAVSATKINATFESGTEVTEEDLAGKTVTLTSGGVSMEATYVANSLTGLKATFELSGVDTLVDAERYDLSSDWTAFAPASFVAKIPGTAKYIADFAVTTTKLADIANNKVYFTAADQYGNDLALTAALVTGVKATAEYADNQFPLAVTGDYANGKFTLTDKLVEGKEAKITLKNTLSGKVKAEKVVVLSIEKITPVATTIEKITGNASLIAGGNAENLTAVVRDQLGNPYTFTHNETLRWTTSNYEIVEFNGHAGDSFVNGAKNATVIKVKPKTVGSVVIKAYLPGAVDCKSFTIDVSKGELAKINASNAGVTVENKGVEKTININSQTKPNVSFENKLGNLLGVSADSVNLICPDEVTISKVANGEGLLTGLKVSADGANQTKVALANNPNSVYNVNISSGGQSANFKVTSKINATVTEIQETPLAADVLVVGGTANQTVVFKNVYDEYVDVSTGKVSVTITGKGMSVDTGSVYRIVNATSKQVEFRIKYDAAATAEAGTYPVMVQWSSSVSETFNIEVAAAAGVKTVEIGDKVEVICNDTYNSSTNPSTTYIDKKSFTIMPIAFKDQYGKSIVVKAQNLSKSLPDVNTTLFNVSALKIGDNDTIVKGTEAFNYIGIHAEKAATKAAYDVNITVSKANQTTGYEAAKVAVTVNSKRVVSDSSLNVTDVTMALTGANAKKCIQIQTLDQYSAPMNVTKYGADISVTNSTTGIVTNDSVAYASLGKYTFSLTAKECGDTTVYVNISKGKDVLQNINKTFNVHVKAGLTNLTVPTLVSGNNSQVFENLNFTTVGKLNSNQSVEIDLSNLVAAGVDFSKVNATKVNAENSTVSMSKDFKKIFVTVKSGKFISNNTNVHLKLNNTAGSSNIINVTSGAASKYNVLFTRSDSKVVDTKSTTIYGNVIAGSATNLDNKTSGQSQDFKFKFDGALERNKQFDIVIKNGTSMVNYSTDATNGYIVTGAGAYVIAKPVIDSGKSVTISLRSSAEIPSGTEVTVTAKYVDTTSVTAASTPIRVHVKRFDTGIEKKFEYFKYYVGSSA